MRPSSFFSRLISGLLFAAGAANAATLPVSEDTCSFPPGKIDKRSGNASTLSLSANGTAFIRFDAGDFSGLIKSTDITSARLTFYITEVGKAGKIGIHRVTSEWTESPAAGRNAPSFDPEPLVTIPAKAVRAGQFAVVDVTTQVRKWLDEPQSDRGFAITCADGASIQIRAKEGSAAGMPASLEIDNHPVVGNKQLAGGISAKKLGDGEVSDAEFAQLNGVTGPIQQQIDGLKTGTGNLGGSVEGLQTDVIALKAKDESFTNYFTAYDGAIHDLVDTTQDLEESIGTKVSKNGDTMHGQLVLPGDGLRVGGSQLVVDDSKVGIGTQVPQAKLDVRGDIKLGASGELSATAGEENLRIVRGIYEWNGTTTTVVAGSGFTITKQANTIYKLTFDKPFSAIPAIIAGVGLSGNFVTSDGVSDITTTSAIIKMGSEGNLSRTSFIAIGPR